jgi:hypothetical protein
LQESYDQIINSNGSYVQIYTEQLKSTFAHVCKEFVKNMHINIVFEFLESTGGAIYFDMHASMSVGADNLAQVALLLEG